MLIFGLRALAIMKIVKILTNHIELGYCEIFTIEWLNKDRLNKVKEWFNQLIIKDPTSDLIFI